MNLESMLSANDDYSLMNFYNELKVHKEKFHFEWELKGFAKIPIFARYPVYSPSFSLAKRSESVFQLLMVKELRCRNKNDSIQDEVPSTTEDMPMEICDSETEETIAMDEESNVIETPTDKRISLGFKIIKPDESSTWEVLKYHVEVKIGDVRGRTIEKIETGFPYPKNPVKQYIYEEDLNGIDLKEVDTICIEAFIEHMFLEINPLDTESQFEDAQIAEDIFELHKHPKFYDVILKADNLRIPVNKCILCARSYGFDYYFQDSKKIPKNKVKIELELVVLQAMLSFIYCGGIPVDYPLSKCMELYKAAVQYRVPGLRLAILQFMIKRKNMFGDRSSFEKLADFQFDQIKFSQFGILEELGEKLISENKYCKDNDF